MSPVLKVASLVSQRGVTNPLYKRTQQERHFFPDHHGKRLIVSLKNQRCSDEAVFLFNFFNFWKAQQLENDSLSFLHIQLLQSP